MNGEQGMDECSLLYTQKELWNGKYRGVLFDVVRWSQDYGPERWNFYLVIQEEQVPPERWDAYWLMPEPPTEFGRVYYNYHAKPFTEIQFPRGTTYYEKLGGYDRLPRGIKIGCDYMHDEGREYALSEVLVDVWKAIDSLWAIEPHLRCRCDYCGKFFHPGYGQSRGSRWYCAEHLKKENGYE